MILKFRRGRVSLLLQNDEIQDALDGPKWKHLVSEFDQFLRNQDKYHDAENAYEFREMLWNMANEMNLKIE